MLVAVTATAATYLLAVPLGLVAGMTRSRVLDEVLMRPLDLLLAVPSMLMLLLLASIAPGVGWVMVAVITLVNLPTSCGSAGRRAVPVRPARRRGHGLQGESRIRIRVGYVARGDAPHPRRRPGHPVHRRDHLVASASFLGVGASPAGQRLGGDGRRNRAGLFIQPRAWSCPPLLVVMLCPSASNLAFDRWLRGRGIRLTIEETP